MPDREKVIKGLEFHLKELKIGKTCFGCPYLKDDPCEIQLIENALSLLKEREDEIRHLRLALQIMNGNGIRVDTEGL